MITNKINGKRYIGQTVQILSARWSKHCHIGKSNKGMAIVRAIQKYGKENFEIKVLSKCKSIEEMNHREAFYIKLFKTQCPNGYNISFGGLNSKHTEKTKKKISEANKGERNPNFGKKASIETRKKQSAVRLGVRRSNEVKKACSDRVQGEKHPMYGKHHTEEAKKKISESNKGLNTWTLGRKENEETRNKKAIASTGRIASKETIEKLKKANTNSDMSILCHQNNMIYPSTSEAARCLNLARGRVRDVLKGRAGHTKGYTFEYTNKPNIEKREFKKKVAIFCYQTDKTYISIAEAINVLGVSAPNIYASLRTGRLTKGYSFEYVDKKDKNK